MLRAAAKFESLDGKTREKVVQSQEVAGKKSEITQREKNGKKIKALSSVTLERGNM